MAFFFNALIMMKSMSRIKDGGTSVVHPDRSLGSLPREE
ncbi:MAG: hypothetical protein ACJAS5_000661 [Lentimonas sp.]|jgi:hypothetical protein